MNTTRRIVNSLISAFCGVLVGVDTRDIFKAIIVLMISSFVLNVVDWLYKK